MPAIVLVSVWKGMGFFGLILLSGVVGINKTYYEAAGLDGANGWVKFTRITLPLLTPSIFYVLIVGMINAFQLFPQIMIMTAAAPTAQRRLWWSGFTITASGIIAWAMLRHSPGFCSQLLWCLRPFK